MRPLFRRIRPCILPVALAAMLSGCLFGSTFVVFSSGDFVSVSLGDIQIDVCASIGTTTFECLVSGLSSRFDMLTPAQLRSQLLLDPVVVQFPTGVASFAGSFSHDSGASGALAITAGLASLPIDVNRTLVAEPGTQLVVIGLPPNAPITGSFDFNLNFRVPPGTTSLQVKPIITGRVELDDGSVFYPPIFPCAHTMAAAPPLFIPLPVPGDNFTLPPLSPLLGCNNVTYDFGGSGGPIFADVPATHFARPWIEALYRAGVTAGCGTNPLIYCPDAPVTREQIAAFLLRAREGPAFSPPACTSPPFVDVPTGSPFCPWIQELLTRGVTIGLGAARYGPGQPVTREILAILLLKTLDPAFRASMCTSPPFADVGLTDIACPYIQELARRGITAGCRVGNYCGASIVTRAELAIFLVKAFGLPL
jgi:hypothetical protein